MMLKASPNTVYAIIFTYRYFCGFGLGSEIREGIISQFSDVFITTNGQIEVEIFARCDSQNSRK